MPTCPHCGERVESADIYCFECGARLDEADDPVERGNRPTGAPTRRTQSAEYEPEPEYGHEPADTGSRHTESRRKKTGRGHATSHQTPAPASQRTTVDSLRTLWAAAVAAVVMGLFQLVFIVAADEVAADLAEEFGEDAEIADALPDIVFGLGVFGLVLAVAILGTCIYYYRRGYVDRRFFWALIIIGGIGVLANLFFIIIVAIGAYGLLVVLKRAKKKQQPPQEPPGRPGTQYRR